MSTENTNTAVALPETFKPEVFKSLIDKAPEIFSISKTRVDKALEVGNKLVALAKQEKEANGKISDELDKRMNDYLVNIRTASKQMNDVRTPVTTMFTAISKLYVALENQIDPTKPETVPAAIQQFRNELATQKAKEAKEKEEAEARRLAIEKEKIECITSIDLRIKQTFLIHLETEQNKLTSIFDSLGLTTYETSKTEISQFSEVYQRQRLVDYKPIIVGIHLSVEEIDNLIKSAKTKLFPELTTEFKETIQGIKEILIDKLPGKKAELEEIARQEAERQAAEKAAAEAKAAAENASKADKARLEAEAKEAAEKAAAADAEAKKLQDAADKRARQDAAKAAAEALAKQQKAESDSKIQSAAMTANTLFDSEVTNIPETTSQVRESYKITVKHALGYQVIAAFYFEKEGKNETIEKLEKKTLGQMKTFAESWAKKNDEKIESAHLVYQETFKAVSKK